MESATHALLVGVDKYNNVRKLKGCVNDVRKVENYLRQVYGQACTVKMLTDAEATKEAVVDGFRQLTEKAGASDHVLFYFTGHGTQEIADPFWGETDGHLECLVCYDKDPGNPADFLMADKELRYLIHKLAETGCHIVSISDCCHSGDNTRNADLIGSAFATDEVYERRLAYAFPQRKWEEFIFHTAVQGDNIDGKNPDELFPQGAHVQISACESDESAIEINGAGVFTSALVRVLENTGGNISYLSLQGRIRQYLRFMYEQQPRIFATAATDEEASRLIYTNFLNREVRGDASLLAEAVFNKGKGWLLNVGAIHGINQGSGISLADPALKDKTYPAVVKKVFIDHALIKPGEDLNSDLDTVFKASVEGMQLHQIKLHIKNHDAGPTQLESLANALISGAMGHFVLTDDEAAASYTLHARPGEVYITRPQDEFRPLVQPVEIPAQFTGQEVQHRLFEILHHISRWNFIRLLESNQSNPFSTKPIRLDIRQVLPDGSEMEVPVNGHHTDIHFSNINGTYKNRLRIRLTNQTSQKLFIAVAYLSYNFQCTTHVLERGVELLDVNQSVSLKAGSKSKVQRTDLISLSLPAVVHEYNWPYYTEVIKVIICNEVFNPEAFNLQSLAEPYTLKDRDLPGYRTFDLDDDPPVEFSGWLTQTLHLTYHNPFFNQVDENKVRQMLAWDKTNFFARGLY